MEKLIILAVFAVLSILHSWWKKRQEALEKQVPPPTGSRARPPRPQPGARPPGVPPPAPPRNWEDELRRLLEGELPVEPPPPAPRPVVAVEPEPVPVPPPLRKPAAPVLADARRAAPSFGGDPDMNIGLPVQMPSMAESAQAFLRASHLEERVAEHMRSVDRRVSEHAPLKAAGRRPPGIAVALSLLRDRESQRAAILAGVILGPPKALGE